MADHRLSETNFGIHIHATALDSCLGVLKRALSNARLVIANLGYEHPWWDTYEIGNLRPGEVESIKIKVAGHVVIPELVWYPPSNVPFPRAGSAFTMEEIWSHDAQVTFEVDDQGVKRVERIPRY